jgi:dTDP-glucose pyrophosphorylase
MIDKKFNSYLIGEESNIQKALNKLNKNQDKCLIVLSVKGKLLGTLTDGDIRRSLINGINFSQSIKKIYYKRPFYIKKKTGKNIEKNIPKNIFKNYRVIPVVNKNKLLIEIFSRNLIKSKNNYKSKNKFFGKEVPVVIMAGGEGKRLLPHTAVIPKPLIPFNGKSMIEHIIERFKYYFFNSFIISLNYKSKLMEAYFSSEKKGTNIKFIHEKKPLGTAGALKKINRKKIKDFFVINCDSLIRCDYISLLTYHLENQYDMTIVVTKKTETLNYGTCKINKKGKLLKITEKPLTTFLANTGFYVLNSKILSLIKKNENIDMNELIERSIKRKFKIGVFPIHESEWQDLGTWLKFKDNS